MCGSQSQVWHSSVALDLRSSIMITISIWFVPAAITWVWFWLEGQYFQLRPSSSMNGSVPLSVSPSVHLSHFLLCSHHCIIIKLYGVIANDESDVNAKGQDQWSKVKVTEDKTKYSNFWTATLIWIHIWRWNKPQSLKQQRRGARLFFKVIRQISRS